MTYFCTLFDANYLTRGLALYESLLHTCGSFRLFVVTFDDNSYHYLKNAGLEHLVPISLSEFEDPQLLAVKPQRSAAEYCWTCTPSVILYCIKNFNLPACTYIDADMIFYEDPQVLIDEMGPASVLVSEHRYTSDYDVAETHGRFCVQFMCFKNNEEGLTALEWWRQRCLEWCYARLEDGKFGDQKYLDDWEQRFKGVHVMVHEGGGLAPWNVQQYNILVKDGRILIANRKTGKQSPLIFFHFHGLKFFTDRCVSYTGTLYDLDKPVKELLYQPYVQRLTKIETELRAAGISFNVTGARTNSPGKLTTYRQYLWERLVLIKLGKISPFSIGLFNFARHYHYNKIEPIE
jgi:hypothetical protein